MLAPFKKRRRRHRQQTTLYETKLEKKEARKRAKERNRGAEPKPRWKGKLPTQTQVESVRFPTNETRLPRYSLAHREMGLHSLRVVLVLSHRCNAVEFVRHARHGRCFFAFFFHSSVSRSLLLAAPSPIASIMRNATRSSDSHISHRRGDCHLVPFQRQRFVPAGLGLNELLMTDQTSALIRFRR